MTAFLILIALIALAELVAGFRFLRHDRPRSAPASHVDWSVGHLPSNRYANLS